MRHKLFPDLLNGVVIVKTKLDTQKCAHVVLFSSDLTLDAAQLVLYYRLRFQIEFNFRAAKQFWGLDDFMNIKQRPVYNAANFALFMGNLASLLIRQRRTRSPAFSVLDLNADYRGRFFAQQTLKFLSFPPDLLLIDDLFAHLASLGAIHP
jgi:putative transposase